MCSSAQMRDAGSSDEGGKCCAHWTSTACAHACGRDSGHRVPSSDHFSFLPAHSTPSFMAVWCPPRYVSSRARPSHYPLQRDGSLWPRAVSISIFCHSPGHTVAESVHVFIFVHHWTLFFSRSETMCSDPAQAETYIFSA